MKKTFFVVAAIIIASTLLAQQSDSTQVNDTTGKLLDEAVVTASKFEQKQSTTGKVVTVVGKEVLEKSVGKSVAQVLNEQAGVTIAGAYNVTGSVQTVFLRGASSGRSLILVDGIPVYDPSMINNEFDLNLISINDIERIEICKGAQSTLYGSDAIAGVINIITVKKDVRKPFNFKTTATLGNKKTFRSNSQLYGRVNKLLYTVRFATLHSNGFSSAHDNAGDGNFDRDGYDGNVVNASLQYQFIPELSAKAYVQYSRYKADVDAGVFTDDRDFTIHNKQLAAGGGLNYKKGIVNIVGNYHYDEVKRRYLNDSLHVPGFTTYESNNYGGRTAYLELYGSIHATKWLTLLAGVDYRHSNMNQQYYSVSSFGPYSSQFDDTSLHQTSFYGSVFISSLDKRWNIEFGGRTNKHSRYGNNSTYTFNPSFSISKNWRLFGSVASGFKAPSIYQLFDAFSGNVDLKPEKSVNFEVGIQELYEKISTRLVYFHRKVKNGLEYNYVTFQYFNLVKQSVDGIELELTLRPVKEFSITANYSYLTGDEQTQSREDFNDTTYTYLLRRPKSSFNILLGCQPTPSFYASLGAKAVSRRHDVGGFQQPDVLLKGYLLLNAYAEYKLNDHLKFFLDAQNLTNNKFFDLSGFNSIPFMVSGGVSFNW